MQGSGHCLFMILMIYDEHDFNFHSETRREVSLIQHCSPLRSAPRVAQSFS